jgi:hypothetical protein
MNRFSAVQIANGNGVDLNRRIRKGVHPEDRSSWWSLREILGEHPVHFWIGT